MITRRQIRSGEERRSSAQAEYEHTVEMQAFEIAISPILDELVEQGERYESRRIHAKETTSGETLQK